MARGAHMGPSWPQREDAEGAKRWRDGEAVSAIAAHLGRTRNAVISRANRKGWGLHPAKQDWGR